MRHSLSSVLCPDCGHERLAPPPSFYGLTCIWGPPFVDWPWRGQCAQTDAAALGSAMRSQRPFGCLARSVPVGAADVGIWVCCQASLLFYPLPLHVRKRDTRFPASAAWPLHSASHGPTLDSDSPPSHQDFAAAPSTKQIQQPWQQPPARLHHTQRAPARRNHSSSKGAGGEQEAAAPPQPPAARGRSGASSH